MGCLPVALLVAGVIMIRMPDLHPITSCPPLTTDQRLLGDALKADVQTLAGTIGRRNVISRYDALGAAADLIESAFSNAGYQVRRQGYEIDGLEGRPCYNLEVEIRGTVRPDEIVVIGAHYDSAEHTPGANDNASGVAALLALARAFAGAAPERTLRFVAFVNEEPPFFWTRDMGSLVYARRCRERNENIVAMLSLETLGYYSDEQGSQRYPLPLLNRIYPTTGNFAAFIGNIRSRSLVRTTVNSFRSTALCPSEAAFLPGWITGVSWSDHWSFWHAGYLAVMVTDTALFRYRWYHTPEDTPGKLNYDRFALVVAGLETVVADLAGVNRTTSGTTSPQKSTATNSKLFQSDADERGLAVREHSFSTGIV
ncbi:MAG: M28 family peptidase [Verrucomicrobia bacterium]|nr:M28 family peptidase [Verrucomicrobiota bacterium]MBU4247238.1 M28 family peptidase [Verrucomicrobiota bacterium]MBU4289956.1 M28 family peptidase [Verrucomicrobiota bacterium]MBU4498049.1 M28 family peptidase [Verrucomicrobiota bacterium]